MVGSNSATFGAGEFRCDYGRGLSVVSRCVFPTATETFSRLSATDPTHAQAADHILTALYQPSLTMPPVENKVIPGLPGGLYPLTRAVDQHTIRRNRVRARGACLRYDTNYKRNRRELGLECDEFPFASTLQGAASGGDFSVRGIPAADNQAGGAALQAWYNVFRILEYDEFYVAIRP